MPRAAYVFSWAAMLTIANAATITVPVCMTGAASDWQVLRAQTVAADIFEKIGVRLLWRSCRHAEDSDIHLGLIHKTPTAESPGALALAHPFEGVHIEVFYDRIQGLVDAKSTSALLAHVLVHEIGHMLERCDRHAQTGMMKAHWDPQDMEELKFRPLAFSPLDIEMIREGAAAREVRLSARRPAKTLLPLPAPGPSDRQ